MIKLFFDKKLRLQSEWHQVFPLIELLEKETKLITELYEIVDSVEKCDFGIIPMSMQYLMLNHKKKESFEFIEFCKNKGKKVLVFSGGDFGVSINDSNVITIRLGGFNSVLNANTFIMPPFIDDPYTKIDKVFSTIVKDDQPTIGFVGHSNGGFLKFIKEFAVFLNGNYNRLCRKDMTEFQKFYPSSIKRFKYLKIITKINYINCDFILRKKYRAGAKNSTSKEKTTVEFYENMNSNLFTFCLRGSGNFSVRFYETLAMGRIPVLIDTDCRLPFLERISWRQHCVIIAEKEIKKVPSIISDFHKNRSNEKLQLIQENNRELWHNYFTKTNYFVQFSKELRKNYI